MKHLLTILAFARLAVADALRAAVCPPADMANIVAGTVLSHPGVISRRAEAITARKLLVRQGTAADQCLIGTAAAMPIGWVDTTAAIGDIIPVNLLGSARETAVLTAGAAITAGSLVFAAAAGKVTVLPAGAGTYWCVGTALTAAGDDGDEIEVDPCAPRPVVVSG